MNLTFNRLFVFTKDGRKTFDSSFVQGVNIIHGPNTSGKSTIFQLILYAFGINEYKEQLKDILEEDIIVRIDCMIKVVGGEINLILIRDDEYLTIKVNEEPASKFLGVGGNSSREHIRLKEYLGNLFGFTMHLEGKDEYKQAPIEAMFLPYYVSQSLGWVYLRKSFSALDWFKNFKNDFFDYYLGIEKSEDRLAKQRLQSELYELRQKHNFYANFESTNQDLTIAQIADERFIQFSIQFVKDHSAEKSELKKTERLFVLKCNELAKAEQRRLLLLEVNRNHSLQMPGINKCPTCEQPLSAEPESIYHYFVEHNDSDNELKILNNNIKELAGEINGLESKIKKLRTTIKLSYDVLASYDDQNVNYDNWLNNKSNVKLSENVTSSLGSISKEISEKEGKLEDFKTPEQVEYDRKAKSISFQKMFTSYLPQLDVKALTDDRYTDLYKISAFPYQGVELHNTVLAYHFAFNNTIRNTKDIHRFPFLLDGIFKEDMTPATRKLILDFIERQRPLDSQIILSIANDNASDMIGQYAEAFTGRKHLILIGDGMKKRSMLVDSSPLQKAFMTETQQILYGTLKSDEDF
ncbi:hypothetical protein [Chitinophaga rhizophila]|uniref:AAA domain-containing protein n=1 Tax=Chitinophaga rhizophila TaxID=2866212 RepID=A0ABS7G890_9BACT|nr:hypothetical protein [Chitinophaga rhizophila]MBW8683520.1 hypothetical protein [Chitinophaga rhizophila]